MAVSIVPLFVDFNLLGCYHSNHVSITMKADHFM